MENFRMGGTNYSGIPIVQNGNQVLLKQYTIGFLQSQQVLLLFIKVKNLMNGRDALITTPKINP